MPRWLRGRCVNSSIVAVGAAVVKVFVVIVDIVDVVVEAVQNALAKSHQFRAAIRGMI